MDINNAWNPNAAQFFFPGFPLNLVIQFPLMRTLGRGKVACASSKLCESRYLFRSDTKTLVVIGQLVVLGGEC